MSERNGIYNLEEIFEWQDGIPVDEFGQALCPGELYDLNKTPTPKKDEAYYARETTNPYGLLKYVAGSREDFICFDFYQLPDERVVLHSVINNETMGFMDDAEYFVVGREVAPDVAHAMVQRAVEWLAENDIQHDDGYWGKDPFYFFRQVAAVCRK